jgi:tRNA(Ile)-lysidine synthase
VLGPAAFEQAFQPLADGPGSILAAVSGGPDSTALMHALAAWRGAGRPAVRVATVDHGLRPDSPAEAEAVGAAARALGLDHAVLTWRGRPPGRVAQAAARRARYDLLAAFAREVGATHLATAHTLDDQAETLLMRLAAGSGPAGLAGMRAVTCRRDLLHVRPFLRVPKAALVATCQAQGWSYAEDPSNTDPRFARARWRRLAPLLAAEGFGPERLAKLADRLSRADEALADAAKRAFAALRRAGRPGEVALNGRRLVLEAEEIALRVLGLALAESDAEEGAIRLARLESCLSACLAAVREGRAARRTLAGRLVSVLPDGTILIEAEPTRLRGRRGAVTEIAAGAPHSLGIRGGRA